MDAAHLQDGRLGNRSEVEADSVRGEVRGCQPRCRVCANRVKGHVAEVEQACISDDHVQPDRHHREDDHRDHRVHARKRVEDRKVEQESLVVRLLDEEGVSDHKSKHGRGHGEAAQPRRQQVEHVRDQEQDDQGEVRRKSGCPGNKDHDARNDHRRHRPLQERRPRLPAAARVPHPHALEAEPQPRVRILRQEQDEYGGGEGIHLGAPLELARPGQTEHDARDQQRRHRTAHDRMQTSPGQPGSPSGHLRPPRAFARRAVPAAGRRGSGSGWRRRATRSTSSRGCTSLDLR